MKHALTVLLLVFATLGSGCSELDPFLPKVTFSNLKVRDINFQEADVDFVFDVDNPNPIGFNLSSFSYALGFEEIQLLAGDNEDGFALEADGNSELILPVDLIFADAWN
ncbi:MAG: LEA type 2 family protein, partial [Proteobacteria bacterium]|nr:LEA type 2 family protein [Pseudomonadota bacterium]